MVPAAPVPWLSHEGRRSEATHCDASTVVGVVLDPLSVVVALGDGIVVVLVDTPFDVVARGEVQAERIKASVKATTMPLCTRRVGPNLSASLS